MIEVENLHKAYGNQIAVEDVSFTIRPGKILGLVGPPAAGKTTVINCISGVVEPTSGQIQVLGHDVTTDGREVKCQLGIVPQEFALYEDLSAAENLKFWGGAHGLKGRQLKQDISDALAAVGLLESAKKRVGRFTDPMKRRLNLACAIIHRPASLLLDEPIADADPQTRSDLFDLVRERAARGTCVLYATNSPKQAEELCDELVIVDQGRVVDRGTLSELLAMAAENELLKLSGNFDPVRVRQGLATIAGVELAHAEPDELRLVVEKASQRLPEILSAVNASGAEIQEVTLTQPSLESLFRRRTGKPLTD